MRVMRIIVGVIKDKKGVNKEAWKLRRERPLLFLFLDNCNSLSQKFRMLINGHIFTEKELTNGVLKNSMRFSNFNGHSGKIDIPMPKLFIKNNNKK